MSDGLTQDPRFEAFCAGVFSGVLSQSAGLSPLALYYALPRDWTAWAGFLAANGYVNASTVREPGDFALRGGIVDLWPPGSEQPLRLDFFGPTLDAIRCFDAETQLSGNSMGEIALLPASESWQQLGAGGAYFCARAMSGAVACWGRAAHGALGNGGVPANLPSRVRESPM